MNTSPSTHESDYENAQRLLRGYIPDPRRQTDLLHSLRVVALARAVAEDQHVAARRIAADLGSWNEETHDAVTAALHDIRVHRPDPALADWRTCMLAWRDRLSRACHTDIAGPRFDSIAWIACRDDEAWRTIARLAHAAARPGRQLVVFGLGRNGSIVAETLASMRLPALAADDNPEARCPLARIDPAALTDAHAVLITPDRRESIVYALKRRGVTSLILPEQLAIS